MIRPRFIQLAILRGPTAAAAALAGSLALLQPPANAQSLTLSLFERYLDTLRLQAGIPGLSVAIVQDGRIWDRGFGHQDLENAVAARHDTPYPIGDLTQTFAAVLLMDCVERGTLSLQEPLSKWSRDGGDATVRQALTHATTPVGAGYRYDPAGFARLASVVSGCGGTPARARVAQAVFDSQSMLDSVPGRDLEDVSAGAPQMFDERQMERYGAVLRRLAVPYKVDRRGKATRSEYPSTNVYSTTGLVSTARDLARFDLAIDERILLGEETVQEMFTNRSPAGLVRPTGLGWFVQTYNGEKLVWHFAYVPEAYSALVLKVPSRRLTLILLANSDGLSAPFDLAQGDVTSSIFAVTFLRLFL